MIEQDYRERVEEALQTVMKTEAGRTLIYYLLMAAGAEEPLYYGGDSGQMAFAAGRRSLAEELLAAIRELDNGLELEAKMRYEARAEPGKETLGDDFKRMTGGGDFAY